MSFFASPAVKVLATLASFCLVMAFALATTLPPGFTLAQVVTRWSPSGVAATEAFVMGNVSAWAWRELALPMLARPAWLLPVDVALVLGGVAGSIALRRARPAERKRG